MPLVPPATRIVLSLSLTRAPPAASLGSSYSPLLLDVVGRQKACRLVRRQAADQYRASRRRDDAIAPERFPRSTILAPWHPSNNEMSVFVYNHCAVVLSTQNDTAIVVF